MAVLITPIPRQPWHDLVVDNLRRLGDQELQRAAWIEGEGGCPDATELLCGLFDDSGLDDLLEAGDVFWPELDHHLRVMSQFCERIGTERPPQEILEDPLWKTLAVLSVKALEALEARLEPATL